MESRDLAFFVAVAEAGSITGAADRLHCVQSNVTARLRALEAAVATPLFHRSSRGVSPTRAGEALLGPARKVCAALEEARAVAASLTDPDRPSGRLALGSMESTAAVRMPEILAAFHRAHPTVDLSASTGSSAALTADVLGHRLDAALIAGPCEHAELVADPVGTERMALVLPAGADWPLKVRQGRLTAFCFRSGCTYRAWLEGMLADLGLRHTRLLDFGTLDGILGGVASGIGFTYMPVSAVAASRFAGKVSLHTPQARWREAQTVLIRRADALETAALAAFRALARRLWDELQTEMPLGA
ncbi:MAG: LysR family transcriptional regulator [Rhodospirillaceae bacterium]|nr:LysR family transcriptional regulator [Rhodospirillaceae bacterium]